MNDPIDRAQAMMELQINAKRMTLAYEAHGEGEVVHSDIVIRLSDAIDILRGLPQTTSEHDWISCSKRTPIAKYKTYWICTDTGYQCECRWTNVNHFWTDLTTEWHWHFMDIPQYSKVAAWRELPEPYREEGEADG